MKSLPTSDIVWILENAIYNIKITDDERKHEMVYVFNNSNNDDIELTRNKDMREYAEKVKNYINKPYSQFFFFWK